MASIAGGNLVAGAGGFTDHGTYTVTSVGWSVPSDLSGANNVYMVALKPGAQSFSTIDSAAGANCNVASDKTEQNTTTGNWVRKTASPFYLLLTVSNLASGSTYKPWYYFNIVNGAASVQIGGKEADVTIP